MKDRKRNSKLVSTARKLRKNMTKEERKLWYEFLKDYPIKFYRQRVVGKYVVDFYCAKANLVVELDGSTHYEPANQEKDEERTQVLNGFNLDVVRVPNNYVKDNFSGVCEYLDQLVKRNLQ